MRIEYLPLAEVAAAAAPTNAKAHDVPAIADSIASLGYFDPMVLDERTGLILAGHGRVEALQYLQADDDYVGPPANVAQGDDGAWLVPVVHGWASHDDQHAEAARLAANRLPERGGWDTPQLAEVLAGLAGSSYLGVAGFTDEDLDELWASVGDVEELTELPDGVADYSEAADPPEGAETPSTPGSGSAPARRAAGLREAYLVMSVDDHAEYTDLVKRYRAWQAVPADAGDAQAVLGALRMALGGS